MALARKCDRCGKFHEYYPEGNKVQFNAIKRLHKNPTGTIGHRGNPIDLCPECMSEFDNWMIAGKFGEEALEEKDD